MSDIFYPIYFKVKPVVRVLELSRYKSKVGDLNMCTAERYLRNDFTTDSLDLFRSK